MLKYLKCKTGESYLFIPNPIGSNLTERLVSIDLNTMEIRKSNFGCVCMDSNIQILQPVSYMTLYLIQKWLRESYKIEIDVYCDFYNSIGDNIGLHYKYAIYNINNVNRFQLSVDRVYAKINNRYKTYESALEAGIEEVLINL